MRWVDGHKGVFSVELTAVSSVHPQVGGGARAQESGPGVGQQFPLTREAWLRAIGHDFGQRGQAPGKLLTQAGAAVPVAVLAGALAFAWSLLPPPDLSLVISVITPHLFLFFLIYRLVPFLMYFPFTDPKPRCPSLLSLALDPLGPFWTGGPGLALLTPGLPPGPLPGQILHPGARPGGRGLSIPAQGCRAEREHRGTGAAGQPGGPAARQP